MKHLAITLLLLFTALACTVEENNQNEVYNEVTTENVSLTMVENPENGDIVGMVEGNSNNGTLSYTIVSQTPEDAMEINVSTGELTVADKTEFEYQINPVISATVQVSNGTNFETSIVTVDLEERSNILIGDVEIIRTKSFFAQYPLLFPNIAIIIAVFTILISIINKFRGIKYND